MRWIRRLVFSNRASSQVREPVAGLCRERSMPRARDRRGGSRPEACWRTDRLPRRYSMSGPLRRPDRGWRLERLLAPKALAARMRKTTKRKMPIRRLGSVSCFVPSHHVCMSAAASGASVLSLRARTMVLQPKLHQLNLRLLVGDDLLGQATHLRIFAVKQDCPRHVDRTLVMRNHHGNKITIRIAGVFRLMHRPVHRTHRFSHELIKCFIG